MRIPVIHSAISLAIHIVLLITLLKLTGLGVYALIIGNVSFPLIVCILNMRSITSILKNQWDWKRSFLLPFLAAAVMGVVTWSVYQLLHWITGGLVLIPLAVALVIAVGVYGFLILKLHCFTKDELLQFPLGGRIVRLARL